MDCKHTITIEAGDGPHEWCPSCGALGVALTSGGFEWKPPAYLLAGRIEPQLERRSDGSIEPDSVAAALGAELPGVPVARLEHDGAPLHYYLLSTIHAPTIDELENAAAFADAPVRLEDGFYDFLTRVLDKHGPPVAFELRYKDDGRRLDRTMSVHIRRAELPKWPR